MTGPQEAALECSYGFCFWAILIFFLSAIAALGLQTKIDFFKL